VDLRKTFGHWGEEQAAKYLLKKGYSIVAQNYRCRNGEIDLIVSKAKVLVFVEVKARKTLAFGVPAAAVTRRKQAKLRATAWHYLGNCREHYLWIRFDVIEIYYLNQQLTINHLINCF